MPFQSHLCYRMKDASQSACSVRHRFMSMTMVSVSIVWSRVRLARRVTLTIVLHVLMETSNSSLEVNVSLSVQQAQPETLRHQSARNASKDALNVT